MDEFTFIERVSVLLDLPIDEAEALCQTVLYVLAERMTADEAWEVAGHVPEELRPFLSKANEEAEAYTYGEFLDRVVEDADVDYTTAEQATAAVLLVLREALGEKEFSEVLSRLPKEFRELVWSRPRLR